MSVKTPNYKELKNFLTKYLDFVNVRQTGSHITYTGEYMELKRNVTLDKNHDKFPPRTQNNIIASMAKQMGYSNKKEFLFVFELFISGKKKKKD